VSVEILKKIIFFIITLLLIVLFLSFANAYANERNNEKRVKEIIEDNYTHNKLELFYTFKTLFFDD
tara:strand:- start:566 stop:763 length:198 start_codon:yes stop_codon:yes gene_type:complete